MSLNSLYSTPLHGVDLFQSTDANKRSDLCHLPFRLEIEKRTVRVSSDNQLLWSLTDSGTHYHTQLNLFQVSQSAYILDVMCEGLGRFYITPNKIAIDWREGTDSVHYFQTLAIAIWLELKGIICIHANALVKGDQAIALVGPSGMGKSTLSAYLQSQGYTWLTDDMLAIHTHYPSSPRSPSSSPRSPSSSPRRRGPHNYHIYPSWPNARMWPDSVQQVTNLSTQNLNKVHSNFSKVAIPIEASSPTASYQLKAIYMLNRHGAELAVHNKNERLKQQKTQQVAVNQQDEIKKVNVIPMQSSQGIIALVQNSMLGSAYAKLNIEGKSMEQTRLANFVELLNTMPFKQINYPNNFDSLNEIKTLIETDLQTQAQL